jgi:hypothetical protein
VAHRIANSEGGPDGTHEPGHHERNDYAPHNALKIHMQKFLMAYNFARCLGTLRRMTSYECIGARNKEKPKRFDANPHISSGTEHLAYFKLEKRRDCNDQILLGAQRSVSDKHTE